MQCSKASTLRRQCPLWVKSRHMQRKRVMSALPPKADMCSALGHVGFGPIADIAGDGVPFTRADRTVDTRSVIGPTAQSPFLAVQARLVVGA